MLIPQKGQYRLLKENTDPKQVAYYMAQLIGELAANDPLTQDCAQSLLAICENYPDFLYKLGNFAYQSAYFVPDLPGRQVLRTVQATLRDKSANCVDYTIFIGSIARAVDLKVEVKIIQLPGQNQFTHVYPVVNNTPIDVTIGQDQSGKERETRVHQNLGILGVEVPNIKSFSILAP